MLVGYMRISKADGSQVLDLQHDALLAAGVEADHIYQDKASGSKDDRPGLTACLKELREGDVLVIWKLDRLGRNLRHLIETLEDLSKRGVGFKDIHGAPIDPTTSQANSCSPCSAPLRRRSPTSSASAPWPDWPR